MAGPVALVGSGEFLPVMEAVDASLLKGRPPRAVIVPTASAPEGADRFGYWMDLGRRHYEAMGVEPVALAVATREDAQRRDLAELVAGAGLVYLSGGNPHYLASTLRDSAVWRAIVEAWHGGAALAGCSAGAMALTAGAPGGPLALADTEVLDGEPNGLGAVDGLAVIPHFDHIERWRPGMVGSYRGWLPPDTTLIGIDDETALVSEGGPWLVAGTGSVWVLAGEQRIGTEAGGQPDLGRESPAF